MNEGESIVVVPRVVDKPGERGPSRQAYEERLLFLLLLLRQPRLRIIYVTSLPIDRASSTTTSACSRVSSHLAHDLTVRHDGSPRS